MSSPTEQHLSPGETHGLIITVVAGFCSTVMSGGLLIYVLYRVCVMRRENKPLYPITLFYVSLLFWGIFQGMGWVVSIRWIRDARIVMGEYCVAQAVIKQLGTSGIALSIIGISWCIFHDHVSVDGATGGLSTLHGYKGLGVISLIQMFNIAIPNVVLRGAYHYYGIAGYCWIANEHFATKIITHYLWYWTAGLVSLMTAAAYFFSARYNRRLPAGFLWVGFPTQGNGLLRIGLFTFDHHLPNCTWSMDFRLPTRTLTLMLIGFQFFKRNPCKVAPSDEKHKAFAFRLVWFPISYLATIIPQSIVRFMQFSGKRTSPAAAFIAATIIALTGVADVALFALAKPAFGIFPDNSQPPAIQLPVRNHS